MKYKKSQIFGIPIIKKENVYTLNNDELSYLKTLPVRESDPDNGALVGKNVCVLQDEKFKTLREKINECASSYIDDILCVDNEFEMTNSWFAKSKKEHKKHDHKNTIFSVVYYAQAENSIIRFFRSKNIITETFNFDLEYNSYNEFNSTSIDFDVRTGDVIIFPGHLPHKGINYSDKEKIIIGANYFIRGSVGKDRDITSLII